MATLPYNFDLPIMKISGFSFCRNAAKLYYPVVESIRSILPICDEFVVAVGRGDKDDRTRELIEGMGDPRVRIIDTEWTDREKLRGWIHSQQTNIALNACKGDWCFYLQSDEVVHERDLPVIKARCEQLQNNARVQGLVFRYLHFWGDYQHVHRNHAWYSNEIRIVRNGIDVQSFRTAQSFRHKLKRLHAARVDAEIFHYGWVRPPALMKEKSHHFFHTHHGKDRADEMIGTQPFDYGSLEKIPLFQGSHPTVMKVWLDKFDWADQLQYTGPSKTLYKHDFLKNRILTFIEQQIFADRLRLGVKPYKSVWGV